MKLHKSLVLRRGETTITRTLCGRLRTTSDGMNIASGAEEVTCKFCLKLMRQQRNKAA